MCALAAIITAHCGCIGGGRQHSMLETAAGAPLAFAFSRKLVTHFGLY